ncbi:WAS/WASL-interacting protein family member 1-like [Pollicipes pollicipes]|uniref:WAS/WASL-interacting protein family member 1-like n=1 Tax=Pollicipes pollicipes TaxID=41117 RepID=UPI0018857C3D|nr:WAS/WASL-interacting protein family member 1-like [Pollicipes pollicipes]
MKKLTRFWKDKEKADGGHAAAPPGFTDIQRAGSQEPRLTYVKHDVGRRSDRFSMRRRRLPRASSCETLYRAPGSPPPEQRPPTAADALTKLASVSAENLAIPPPDGVAPVVRGNEARSRGSVLRLMAGAGGDDLFPGTDDAAAMTAAADSPRSPDLPAGEAENEHALRRSAGIDDRSPAPTRDTSALPGPGYGPAPPYRERDPLAGPPPPYQPPTVPHRPERDHQLKWPLGEPDLTEPEPREPRELREPREPRDPPEPHTQRHTGQVRGSPSLPSQAGVGGDEPPYRRLGQREADEPRPAAARVILS